jgi:hypothetical protein
MLGKRLRSDIEPTVNFSLSNDHQLGTGGSFSKRPVITSWNKQNVKKLMIKESDDSDESDPFKSSTIRRAQSGVDQAGESKSGV